MCDRIAEQQLRARREAEVKKKNKVQRQDSTKLLHTHHIASYDDHPSGPVLCANGMMMKGREESYTQFFSS